MPSTFYNLDHLNREQRRELCEYTYSVCDEWWVDELDCRVSVARRTIDVAAETALNEINTRTLFSAILRDNEYLEIGFRTSIDTNIEYFLWLIVRDREKIKGVLDKFQLMPT